MLKTGAEYLESIRDGHTVYIGSEAVTDVTTHPRWVQQLIARRGINCAIVALANKMARVALVLLSRGVQYQPTR
jgi:hypothetical protein